MLKIWKRLWIPVIFFVLTVIGFLLGVSIDGDAGEIISALSFLIIFPLFVVTFFWAIIKSIRQTIRVKKGIEPIPDESGNSVLITLRAIVNGIKNRRKAYKEMDSYMKKRYWGYKLVGAAITALGIYVFIPLTTFAIVMGTIIVCVGLGVFVVPNMNSYSDLIKMISLSEPAKIEDIYEAFKNFNTPLGAPYLANIKFYKQPVLIFGPNTEGLYIYCYLNNAGRIFYIGETFVNTITGQLTLSTNPYRPVDEDNLSTKDLICWNSDIWVLKANLFEVFTEYFNSGKIIPLKESKKAKIYTFDENFKLLGQKFNFCDLDKNVIYKIEGNAPLVSLSVKDAASDEEVIKMVKQIDKILTTYNFYKDGKLYSSFHRDPSLAKDIFVMDCPDGQINLSENIGYIGTNYTVRLNGEIIGTIMDNLKLTIRNIVFDNSIVFVYDDRYTSLIAAMAVMVAREIARDRNRASNLPDED